MVNNATNINKTNNHLSYLTIERKMSTAYDIGNEWPGFLRALNNHYTWRGHLAQNNNHKRTFLSIYLDPNSFHANTTENYYVKIRLNIMDESKHILKKSMRYNALCIVSSINSA